MNIQIQSLDFTAKEELKNFVTKKVTELSHFNNSILNGEVKLKLDKNNVGENKICEIRLSLTGNDLFAKKQCSTFEEATQQTIDALRKQIEKLKE